MDICPDWLHGLYPWANRWVIPEVAERRHDRHDGFRWHSSDLFCNVSLRAGDQARFVLYGGHIDDGDSGLVHCGFGGHIPAPSVAVSGCFRHVSVDHVGD